MSLICNANLYRYPYDNVPNTLGPLKTKLDGHVVRTVILGRIEVECPSTESAIAFKEDCELDGIKGLYLRDNWVIQDKTQ